MHESCSRTKRTQGFHGPKDECGKCIGTEFGVGIGAASNCPDFHADLIPWEQLPGKQKDINRHAFDAVLPYFERLLAAEREPMGCGHPKACLVPEHFFVAMKPCNKPYDVYVCEICGQNMHKHTDGGGTAWIMKEYCSACAEREKVRVKFELALLPRKDEADVKYAEASAVVRADYEHGRSDGLAIAVEVIRQLDLTQGLAANSAEEGKE
jgi:hypothetical protein